MDIWGALWTDFLEWSQNSEVLESRLGPVRSLVIGARVFAPRTGRRGRRTYAHHGWDIALSADPSYWTAGPSVRSR